MTRVTDSYLYRTSKVLLHHPTWHGEHLTLVLWQRKGQSSCPVPCTTNTPVSGSNSNCASCSLTKTIPGQRMNKPLKSSLASTQGWRMRRQFTGSCNISLPVSDLFRKTCWYLGWILNFCSRFLWNWPGINEQNVFNISIFFILCCSCFDSKYITLAACHSVCACVCVCARASMRVAVF